MGVRVMVCKCGHFQFHYQISFVFDCERFSVIDQYLKIQLTNQTRTRRTEGSQQAKTLERLKSSCLGSVRNVSRDICNCSNYATFEHMLSNVVSFKYTVRNHQRLLDFELTAILYTYKQHCRRYFRYEITFTKCVKSQTSTLKFHDY